MLAGGSPVRVLWLTPAGTRYVTGWLSGTPVPDNTRARALARRLLDTGIAHPVPDRGAPDCAAPGHGPGPADVTVVIPVRDRQGELARCLAGLAGMPRVIVVDDGSADPAAIARAAAGSGARVLRWPVNGGPGAARNTGLAAADTPLVAFLDSDCVPGPGWLDALLPHLADPAIGAVAPRIVPAEPGRTWLARYEEASSTLDMGARPSIVRPGSRVPYVPSAALVVRRAAAGAGFDEAMRVGEDVDFVWRLAAAGWRVRYEPAASMRHQHPVRLRAWFARRKDYGTSAASLELRHPGTVRPLQISAWTALAWLAGAAATRPRAPPSPALASPCSPGASRRSPASSGPGRGPGPHGSWRAAWPAAGLSRQAGRWAGPSPGPGGRPRRQPRWRCAGRGTRWPRWSSRRRCSTGWTGGRHWIRRVTSPRGCSTMWPTASASGRAAPGSGPSGRCCRSSHSRLTGPTVHRAGHNRSAGLSSRPWAAGPGAHGYLDRPAVKSAGTTMSSGDRSCTEGRPSASRVESMPPRSTSKTFFTPAEPPAARPHR